MDHSRAVYKSGTALADAPRAAWLPILTNGWFIRAESFYSIARYLDVAALDAHERPPDFLSHSHGEGFLRFFEERFRNRPLCLLDGPESALSTARQLEFMKFLRRVGESLGFQAIIATHSPLLMAYHGAKLMRIGKYALEPIRLEDTDHFNLLRDFCADPASFIELALSEAS